MKNLKGYWIDDTLSKKLREDSKFLHQIEIVSDTALVWKHNHSVNENRTGSRISIMMHLNDIKYGSTNNRNHS